MKYKLQKEVFMNWYLPNLRKCFSYRPIMNQPTNRSCNPSNNRTGYPLGASPSSVIPNLSSAPAEKESGFFAPPAEVPCTKQPTKNPPKVAYRNKPVTHTYLLKCDTLSSIIIPDGTPALTRYPLAVLTMYNAKANIRQSLFTFSCNIRTENAVLFLNFHITQQGKNHVTPIPIQSNWNYSRQTNSTLTDAVTFSTCCSDLICDECCTICFWADLINANQGTTYITNSILTALTEVMTDFPI